MTFKKTLANRIRGWFPQEPYLRGNYAKVDYENKQHPQIIQPLYNGRAIQSIRPLIILSVILDLFLGYLTIAAATDFGGKNFPPLMIIWVIAGIIVATASGVMQIRRIVQKLSKDYHYEPCLRDLVYSFPVFLLSLPASGIIALYYGSLLVSATLQFVVSVFALNTAALVARYVLFSAYEKKENMSIVQTISGGGLIVIPQPPDSFSGSSLEVRNWTISKTGGGT